ncbi:ATP synthase subunit e, mitochondrial [Holothuria leucospilota]|uniref:ATP synthase F(0) complex subunit e, mitochondrial n=1 Tax=Holothuria leucospilota TaxID=206669 RepID=A0A9Q1BH50_HOLLE|nr:ATP synthase subunit e, mitochondrial [Holothuria leucospilota]
MAPAPVAVSPLIKFGRYSALLLGIAYGSRHHKTLQKKEDVILARKEKMKAEEEKKKAAAQESKSEGSIFD